MKPTDIVAEHAGALVELLRNWIALGLAGLGLTISDQEYIGGVLVALAMAGVARRVDIRSGATKITISAAFTAVLFSTMAVGIIEWMEWDFPLWIAMGLVGFFSRPLARMMFKTGVQVEERRGGIVEAGLDRIVPRKDGK